MRFRKKIHLPFLLLLLGLSSISAETGEDLFTSLLMQRLEESLDYRQAVLDRRAAELSLRQLQGSAVPYIDIVVPNSSIIVRDGAFEPLSINPTVRWPHIFGTTLAVSSPIQIGAPDYTPVISLQASRRIFTEESAALLRAKAALLRARDAEDRAKRAGTGQLFSDIAAAYLAKQRLLNSRREGEILERQYAATLERVAKRTLEQRILRNRRAILQSEMSLRESDPRILDNLADLYEDGSRYIQQLVETIPDISEGPDSSVDIEILELSLAASSQEAKRWFVPYLPNPLLGFNVDYRTETQSFGWTLSVSFSLPLSDRGERALAALKRREQPNLDRLRLQQAYTALKETFFRLRDERTLVGYDLAIQELTIEESQEELDHRRRLYEGGFETEEQMILAEVAHIENLLAKKSLEHRMLLQGLELLRIYEVSNHE